MLIGLCGFKRSGKDTIAGVLVVEAGYTRLAFADPIKGELAAEGVQQPPDDQKEVPGPDGVSYRDKLIARGEGRRSVDPDHWVKKLAAEVDALPPDTNIVIADCRRANEMEWVRSRGGVLVWIARDGVSSNGHDTERDNSAGCDFTLVNNGPAPHGSAIHTLCLARLGPQPYRSTRCASR